MPSAIASFSGVNRFLSNFSPVMVTYRGDRYPSVEHAYQAAKTLDPEVRSRIRLADNPGEAKRMGQQLALRPRWEQRKLSIMRRLITRKFAHPQLATALLHTGDANLVEGNHWHDNFWGNCTCSKCVSKVGLNHLGRLLMQVRDELR